jgi:hypothetical protein
MGLFKGMKDMKDMLHATPGLLDQANQMKANAQVMQQQAIQQQAAYQQGGMPGAFAPAPTIADTDLPADLDAPIAGVDLATFAQVSAGLAAYDYDQSKAVGLAAERGIDAAGWQLAVDGWNERIAAHPAVARRFNALYTRER